MLLEPGLIAYAGLASIAAARRKHWPTWTLPAAISPFGTKAIGVLLLGLSMVVALQKFGPAQGAVTWTGQLCVAGAVLVLLMSWRFYAAMKLGVAALLASFVLALVPLAGG